jgi:hypothetical protein
MPDTIAGMLTAPRLQSGRRRARVLACARALRSMASSERAAPALRGIVAEAAEAAAAFLGGSEAPAVRSAACRAILALAALDADAVWLLLVRAAAGEGSGGAPAWDNTSPGTLPPVSQILSAASTARRPAHSAGSGARARALLAQVEKVAPAWHAHATAEELSGLAARAFV